MATVITSYSIHYTKLYDPGYKPEIENGKGILRIPADKVGEQTWKGTMVVVGPDGQNREYPLEHTYRVAEPNVVRITSYNVCYTKLLRILSPDKKVTLLKRNSSNLPTNAFFISKTGLSK